MLPRAALLSSKPSDWACTFANVGVFLERMYIYIYMYISTYMCVYIYTEIVGIERCLCMHRVCIVVCCAIAFCPQYPHHPDGIHPHRGHHHTGEGLVL